MTNDKINWRLLRGRLTHISYQIFELRSFKEKVVAQVGDSISTAMKFYRKSLIYVQVRRVIITMHIRISGIIYRISMNISRYYRFPLVVLSFRLLCGFVLFIWSLLKWLLFLQMPKLWSVAPQAVEYHLNSPNPRQPSEIFIIFMDDAIGFPVHPLRQLCAACTHQQRGAVEACWAHNPEVGGSKPLAANLFAPVLFVRFF